MARPIREIPWLSQRDQIWYAHWHDPKAGREKRLSLGTRDAGEAQARFAEFLSKKESFIDSGTAQLTVSQALDIYYERHVCKNNVAVKRASVIHDHLKEWFKDTPFVEVNKAACRGYIEARRSGLVGGGEKQNRLNKRGADSTIRRELTSLAAAANFARSEQLLGPTATPPTSMPVIEKPAVAPEDQEQTFLTVEELDLALRMAEPELYRFIMVAYYTASRRNAVEVMSPRQVNLKNSTINLTHPNETAAQRKSKKNRPLVPFGHRLRPLIEKLMIENGHTDYLLVGRYQNFYPAFKSLLTELGMGDRSHPHILRHSRATHLLHAGVPISEVASLLGDTEATVERVYKGHCPVHLGKVLAALG